MADKKEPQIGLEDAIHLSWTESEKGWGIRPDGCSLHLITDDSRDFVEAYWARMPDEPPEEYSKPAGEPVKVFVSPKIYKQIQDSENGIRFYNSQERELVNSGDLVYSSQRSGWRPIDHI